MTTSPEEESLVDTLVRVAFVVTAVLTRVGAEHDLSLTQLRAFGVLRDRRVRMAGLADYLGLEKSTMTGLVDRAERRGLVRRGPSATDGRAVDVFLTPDGLRLAELVHDRVEAALLPLTGSLRSPDQRRLTELLARMLGTPGVDRA